MRSIEVWAIVFAVMTVMCITFLLLLTLGVH